MKVVINTKYGGFSLSPLAVQAIAKKEGKECFFFDSFHHIRYNEYKQISLEECEKAIMWTAYSVPNPGDYDLNVLDEEGTYKKANERAKTFKS